MKAITFIIFILIAGASNLVSKALDEKKDGDDLDKKYEQAETFLRSENFSNAISIYEELYNADNSNYNLCYKLGLCYLKSMKEKERAVYYLEKASGFVSSIYRGNSKKERKAPMVTIKLLGEAYHQHSQFDKAIEAFEKYKKAMATHGIMDMELVMEINKDIEMCHTAKKLISRPVKVTIENMGRTVNSAYPDYAPVFSVDQSTMIFTSKRPTNVGGKTYNGGEFFEDIYISTKTDLGWSQAVNIGRPVNTVGNEASVGISADGQEILIYKDDMGDGNIYSTSLKGTKWTTPVKLNFHINSKRWEPSAFISADGSTLYFVSDRPGGFGGRDIYKSHKNAEGEWGRPVNLGRTINTPHDEEAPFLHPDGITLYFSSTGHKTMGGFDIFESKLLATGEWTEPANIGYPINSPGDDVFYVVTANKKTAYFTSLRDGGYGEKDNYSITFQDVEEIPLSLQKGMVLDDNRVPIRNAKITITDNETHDVVGIYHPNSSTGKYVFILTPGKSHNITYEADGYLFHSENVYISKESKYNEITKTINLYPIAVGSKVVLNNIFFDFDKAELRPYSDVELNRLYDFLIKHPNLAVEIAGYTDSKGTDDYNIKLSTDRAMAVTNFLVEKGIKKERIIATGYGKLNPVAPNEKTDGSDDPEGRQLNRRVELKITEIK